MAGAMLAGWLDAGVEPHHFTVIRPSGRGAAPGVRVLTRLPQGDDPAFVLLGVKPQKLDEVAPLLEPVLGAETTLVSILAGVELASLRARFPRLPRIVRAMPNTPVRLRKGVTELFTDEGGLQAQAETDGWMRLLGNTEWFEDEALFAMAGHLSGAGPAFLFRYIDALAEAGAALGLAPDQSARIAAAMVEGAAALAAASPEPPSELARRVASPGGTTEAGLKVLDSGDALRRLAHATLDASRRRGIEMAQAARTRPD